MANLTNLKIQKAKYPEGRKGPFLISDGSGLSLQIMPSGSKSWVLRFMLNGKARTMGLGAFGDQGDGVSLAKARDLAASARAHVKQGLDPLEARKANQVAQAEKNAAKAARSKTFEDVAKEYITAHEVGWTVKHRAQWRSTLAVYAFPMMGQLPIAEVDAEVIERALKPIWLDKNETASRLRGRIEAVLDYAKAKGWRSGENPARWKESLKHRLPNVSRVRRIKHHPALPWQKVPAFITALRKLDSISAKALQFTILNASRSGEVRGAKWREIDIENAIWTIPAERMKAKREHRVPLSEAAIELLNIMKPLAHGPDNLIFPSVRKSTSLSDMALSELLRGMNEVDEGQTPPWVSQDGKPIVVHGFRSTFRDWCEEATSTPHAVSEAALAHIVSNKVEAAYRRTDLFDKRRALMQKWADHCLGRIKKE
jgi:integrase